MPGGQHFGELETSADLHPVYLLEFEVRKALFSETLNVKLKIHPHIWHDEATGYPRVE